MYLSHSSVHHECAGSQEFHQHSHHYRHQCVSAQPNLCSFLDYTTSGLLINPACPSGVWVGYFMLNRTPVSNGWGGVA